MRTARSARRAALTKAVLTLVVLAFGLWLWWRPREIDADTADAQAKAMAVRYAAATGEPVVHFGRARRVAWPDGWEFTWAYRPCADVAALRVFVPRNGRRSRITQHPDCEKGGLGPPPREI